MDANRFDALARALTATPSRRGVTRVLAGLTLSGTLVPLFGLADAGARKRKKKGQGKKKKGGNSPTCSDGKKNGSETGVDCGGASCTRCGSGQGCLSRDDCASAVCTGGTCQTCSPFGAMCGSDADGSCYCKTPEAGGPSVCCRLEEETTVGSCSECPANTLCSANPGSGSFDCSKICGTP